MNDIKVSVNLATFAIAVVVWLALGILLAVPNYNMPSELRYLFSTLTGVILVIVQGFERNVTFRNKN